MNTVLRRTTTGASLTEAVAGLIFLIPLLFILLDVATLVVAQTQNDGIAKHAARAAAGMSSRAARQTTAGMVVASYKGNAISTAPTLNSYSEVPAGQNVTVVTKLTCHLPVPVPFGGPAEQTFCATETEPIVAILAPAEPVGVVANGATGWTQNDDSGFLKVSLPCGPDGGGTPHVTAPVIGEPLSGGGGGGILRGGGGGGGGGGGRGVKPL